MTQDELINSILNTVNNMSDQTAAHQSQSDGFQVQPNTAVIGRGQSPRALYGMNANISLEPLLDENLKQAIYEADPSYPQQYEFEDLMQMLQNVNDYRRYEDAQQLEKDYNNRQLYGDAIAEMLGDSAQGQNLLNEVRARMGREPERPRARERNITGSW